MLYYKTVDFIYYFIYVRIGRMILRTRNSVTIAIPNYIQTIYVLKKKKKSNSCQIGKLKSDIFFHYIPPKVTEVIVIISFFFFFDIPILFCDRFRINRSC